MGILGDLLFALAALGLVGLTLQLLLVTVHRSRPGPPPPKQLPAITILKPLCGLDDALEQNLVAFSALDYPDYEVVLGVKDANDLAFEPARRAVRRWPLRFRLVLQRGEPGLNPKVNQLCTMERTARHEIVVVSDSNVRVASGYLTEIAAHLSDPDVGCVTHPVVGEGERRWGSRLDNLHLSTSVGPGMIGAKLAAGQDIVVGKSMALRRSDIAALGGFQAFKDVLAEDYVIGRAVSDKLGKRVAMARGWVVNVSQDKSVGDFLQRYLRWSVIHRTALRPGTYLSQILLNPIALALGGAMVAPRKATLAALLLVIWAKTLVDLATASALGRRPDLRSALAVPLKDVLLFMAWFRGLYTSTINWRGHRLRVTEGSRLEPLGSNRTRAPATGA